MSTEFILHKDGAREVTIVESGAKFNLDLYSYFDDDTLSMYEGPQHMYVEDTLNMAAKIIYAVRCSYPDEADALAARLAEDIPRGASKA